MDLLWPHSSARAARNNLNVAIHGLRRSLEAAGQGPHVVFRDGCYQLAPDLDLWVDVEAFDTERAWAHGCLRSGDETGAEAAFNRLVALYRGELFADDLEGEWFLPLRVRLEDQYAEALEILAGLAHARDDEITCVDICQRLLIIDPCREAAHRLLMEAYVAQERYHLAARQYATCVDSLHERLGLAPHPDTTALFLNLLPRA